MTITAEFLKQFCPRQATKYLPGTPGIFIHPETKEAYTFATDGRRMVVVKGRLEGLAELTSPNIAKTLIEPCGVPVNTVEFQKFLECDKPTLEKCKDEDCREGRITVTCDDCGHSHQHDCGCEAGFDRRFSPARIGPVYIDRALLMDAVKDITEETILIHVTEPNSPVYLFASDRLIAVMPLGRGPFDEVTAEFKLPV